jgi:hypothetical protein
MLLAVRLTLLSYLAQLAHCATDWPVFFEHLGLKKHKHNVIISSGTGICCMEN